MTSSRLDRLFVLLETGSSAVTRTAAAKQLGEVQRLHPHELNTLLTRTAAFLKSSSWETRVAAAEAVRAIISNVPQWNPQGLDVKSEDETSIYFMGKLNFNLFDITKVLTNSTHLMASEGKEFDFEEDSSLDLKEKLVKQRQLMNARLGLEVASNIGLDPTSFISNEDFDIGTPTPDAQNQKSFKWDNNKKKPLRDVVLGQHDLGLSSREMNRARRKARQAVTKQKSREPTEDSSSDEPEKKKSKIDDVQIKEEALRLGDVEFGECTDWPLDWFCDLLSHDLFNSSWEVRHGAATALREIIAIQGKGAGKSTYLLNSEMEEHHQLWLEDIAIRLLCVLALDRFGDFVSDAVVAPVRETCAQCLCAVLKLSSEEICKNILQVLLQLLQQNEWEARHGGLLGLKYLLAVREDMTVTLLEASFPHILEGLSDPIDDVGAVAASALIPITSKLLDIVPMSIPDVVSKLWDLLAEQDELAAACNSFMGLLAAILSLPKGQTLLPPLPLNDVVPRLWPFLTHSTSSVRKATLQTLCTLADRSRDNDFLQWDAQLLQDAMRHVFQSVLIEHQNDVREVAERAWENLVKNSDLMVLLHAACPFISVWLCLAMQPVKVMFDSGLLIQPKKSRERRKNAVNAMDGFLKYEQEVTLTEKFYIGGSETTPTAVREANAMQVRCMAARMLGLLSCYIVKPAPGIDYSQGIEKPIDCYVKVLLVYLQSKSALQRLMTGLVIAEWAKLDKELSSCPELLKLRLHASLLEYVYFDEIALGFTRLAQETRDFIAMIQHYKVPLAVTQDSALTLEQIQILTGPKTQEALIKQKLKPKICESLEERRKSIQMSLSQTSSDQNILSVSTLASLSGATVMLHSLPEKLTPVVKPLMESIRKEKDEHLQDLTAKHLAELVNQCRELILSTNDKILVNLCTFLRCDPDYTPVIDRTNSTPTTCSTLSPWSPPAGNYEGILTLNNLQRHAEKSFRKPSGSVRGPGRPPTSDVPLEELFKEEDETQKINQIQRRGATMALREIVMFFGENLQVLLPKMWDLIINDLCQSIDPNSFFAEHYFNKDDEAEQLVWSLQVLEVTSPSVHKSLRPKLFEICLSRLCVLLTHPYRAVRHLSSRCLATFALLDSVPVMEVIVSHVLPLLNVIKCDVIRQGAVEAVACIVDTLRFDIVPYVVLLVVPLLGRMSDHNQYVRLMGTHSFATLVQLMPLDGGVPEPPALKSSILKSKRDKEREFLQQLLSPTNIPDYVLPVPIDAELRNYQQAGVNWLAFLNKYELHGILCDDMGLGKTLQSICMLASEHFKKDKDSHLSALPSLVICPPTLIGHWVYEIQKFVSLKYLKPLQYNGNPTERERLRQKFKKYNVIVASYDIVRKDIRFISTISWNYIVLDEGHVIKNGKTRTSIAIKSLVGNHRLILSGTPIQNNVLELWSLFDFLMPGFLGTEKQFTARYSKPILASRDPKCSPKDQEAGALAMEALHRQVLPFVLRRMKEDVLDDLPPKITQDYYCDLSSIQEQLYEDFSKSQAHQTLQQSLSLGATASSMQGNTHVFQALRYLRNVCNHPKLVLNSSHPQYRQILTKLGTDGTLDDINHSAKLPALQQLLQDCGIGATDVLSTTEIVINQHRALIFCQLKAMLDIIEKDLFRKHMPFVTYLRLDGSILPAQRHEVVTRFNSDPSIDVLLLTTQVGGLGLNLTGADTVIFVEHDWNPMKDLQAMDRAHRIGQKKVVNVYRLITRNTLEEKIMGLQKFKVQTANTVISGENSCFESMGTDQLLDLFSNKPTNSSSSVTNDKGNGSVRSILESLPDLWDQKQYDNEYDLSQFMAKLND